MQQVLNLDEALANSYKNFHSKGLDYICLYRSPGFTQKLYFFEGDVSKLPEVVNPHDHRYDFVTFPLFGEVTNVLYSPPGIGSNSPQSPLRFQKFEYRTPLNGGNGFTHVGEETLIERYSTTLRVNASRGGPLGQPSYSMTYNQIHTIKIRRSDTVLLLEQGEDQISIAQPTYTYTQDTEPPSLTGLYDKFTADELIDKLTKLAERKPLFHMPKFE